MSYVNSVIFIVRWLAIVVVSVDLGLVAYILYRRASRNHYYARKDAAQKRFAATIAKFFSGDLSTSQAVELLRTRDRVEREAIRTALLAEINSTTRQPATDLLIALDYVPEWAQQAFGKRWIHHRPARPRRSAGAVTRIRRMRVFAVRRALAVINLGRLSPEWSATFMKQALLDPAPQVARLSVAALGRNPVPDGVPLLLQELHKAVLGQTQVPIRSIKAALVRYPVRELEHFTAWMDHANPRFRFLAVDTIREICRKAEASVSASEFPADLRQWFFAKGVCDFSADVRARSATVIGWFGDAEAAARLRRLLQDENEFVRLHAVRACARPAYSALLDDVLRLVTDKCWRVREAAVKTAGGFPTAGKPVIEKLFLDTADRYASEQIADELQRSGMVLQIVPKLASPNGEKRQAFDVCTKMARLGMDSLLIEHLTNGLSTAVRAQLLEALSPSESPELVAVLQRIVRSKMDPLRAEAESFLRARRPAAAMAEGA